MLDLEKIIVNTLKYYEESVGELSPKKRAEKKAYLQEIAARPKVKTLRILSNNYKTLFGKLDINFTFHPDAKKENLSDPRKPVFYVANHQSNLDSAIIGLGLFKNDFPYPIFAAGDNLFPKKILSSIPNNILRSCGAFKMDRKIGMKKDLLELIGSYMRANLEEGQAESIFPEGSRSRNGQLKEFRHGLIIYALKTFFANQVMKNPIIDDLLFVPLGLSYVTIPDEKYLLKNNNSNAQKKSLVKDWIQMRHNLEDPIYLNVGKPVSAKKFFNEYIPSDTELRKDLSVKFADYLRKRVRHAIPVLPEHIAFQAMVDLSNENGGQIYEESLTERMHRYKERMKKYGRTMMPDREKMDYWLEKMNVKGIISRYKNQIKIQEQETVEFYGNKLNLPGKK